MGEILQIAVNLGSIAIPLVGAVFTFYFKKNQERQAAIRYIQIVRDAWISIDIAGLQDPRVLRSMHNVMTPDGNFLDDEQLRRQWSAYLILNVIYLDFLGASVKLGHNYTIENVRLMLSGIVVQNDLFRLTQSGYSPEFHRFAQEVREKELNKLNSEPLHGGRGNVLGAERHECAS